MVDTRNKCASTEKHEGKKPLGGLGVEERTLLKW
jgi:hypothetical protein